MLQIPIIYTDDTSDDDNASPKGSNSSSTESRDRELPTFHLPDEGSVDLEELAYLESQKQSGIKGTVV